MEKIASNKHSRRHSTGNFSLEHTQVLSRYLKDPVASCHDNCKPLSKKLFTPIPKPSSKDVKIKHQVKQPPIQPKKQDSLKSKSNDPFYIAPSKTQRRRYSDIILPTSGLGDVFNPLQVPAVTRTRNSKKIDGKTESRKDSNSNLNSKSANSAKTNGKISTKTQNGLPKPGIKKGKDVLEKTDKTLASSKKDETPQVKTDETDKNDYSPTSNERLLENGSNEVDITSTTKTDETDNGPTSSERVLGNGSNETHISSDSKKDETPLRKTDETHSPTSNEARISATSKKDETPRKKTDETDEACGSTSNERELGNGRNELTQLTVSTSKKDKIPRRDDRNNGVSASGGMKTETPRRGGKLVKENGDFLPHSMKLKQTKSLDALLVSGTSSPRKFKSGQQVFEENQNQDDKRIRLRKTSSQSVTHNSESHVLTVLKAQEHQKSKKHTALNNVIEETATKLIQTRKSRVQALVGAFEMISETKF